MFPQSEIEDFRQYWRRRKPGSSTALHYTSDVRIFFKWAEGRSPDAVTVHDVDRFIVWQQSLGHAPTMVTRRLIALRMFYDYLAYARDQAVANPVVPRRHYLFGGRHLPRNLTEEVIQRLFAAIGEQRRDRAIFTLMLHAGLRVGEVAALELNQIDLAMRRTPHLRLSGKGQRERLDYLSATAAHYLRDYLTQRPSGASERVFLNHYGQPMTIAGIQWQLARYCRQAGIWLTCHQLRHNLRLRSGPAVCHAFNCGRGTGHLGAKVTRTCEPAHHATVHSDRRQPGLP